MDLLKTILVYMSMVVVASVQNAPDPGSVPAYDEPTPTPYVQAAPTPTSTPTATPTKMSTMHIFSIIGSSLSSHAGCPARVRFPLECGPLLQLVSRETLAASSDDRTNVSRETARWKGARAVAHMTLPAAGAPRRVPTRRSTTGKPMC